MFSVQIIMAIKQLTILRNELIVFTNVVKNIFFHSFPKFLQERIQSQSTRVQAIVHANVRLI